MSPTTIYLERTIDSSHVIDGHPGKCGRLHGHTYRFEIWVTGPIDRAGHGMLVDFLDIKALIDAWDHVHLNDVVGHPTTAELLAATMRERVLAAARAQNPPEARDAITCRVRLWETPHAWAQVG